jgi:hypothetical protein
MPLDRSLQRTQWTTEIKLAQRIGDNSTDIRGCVAKGSRMGKVMLKVLMTTPALVLTSHAATAGGAVGYPTPAQRSQCLDAWNNPLTDGRCMTMKNNCEQSGGVFSVETGVTVTSVDGTGTIPFVGRCNKK